MWITNFVKGLRQADPIKTVVYLPKKPRLELAINVPASRKWSGIVWHHSATKDDLIHKDADGIIAYHKSFRIDFNIVAPPQKEKMPGIEYVKYKNGELYVKASVDKYYEELAKKEKNPVDKRYFELPWMDVGYHGMIESADSKLIFRGGRPLSMIGAHAGYKEFNENYIGLCAIGNYDQMPVPMEIWSFALMVTRTFADKFSIPIVKILGHREVYDKMGVPRQKQCPGRYWDMEKFRAEI